MTARKQVDLTKEVTVCPYCGDVLYYNQNEFYCAVCRKSFGSATGYEILPADFLRTTEGGKDEKHNVV